MIGRYAANGGGQIGITVDGLVALELLYTDPRECLARLL